MDAHTIKDAIRIISFHLRQLRPDTVAVQSELIGSFDVLGEVLIDLNQRVTRLEQDTRRTPCERR